MNHSFIASLSRLRSIVLGATLTACVTAPHNGAELSARDASVSFEGLAPAPRRLVWIEAAPARSGPYSSWSSASARSKLWPNGSVPVLPLISAPVYDWSITTSIPNDRWSTTTDAEGCEASETFVRVRDALHFYRTFDGPSGTTPSGLSCFQSAILAGDSPRAAFDACGSAESPAIRLVSSHRRFVGDVVIDDAADVDALRCYEEIEGSLSVTSTAPSLVSLPRLKRVTGALELVYTSTSLGMSSTIEERCGAMGTVTAYVRKYALPALTAVGGAVTLRQENSFSGPASTQAIDLGLEALTAIGGDLSIQIGQFGGSPCGLTALPKLAGNLTLRFVAFGEIGSDSNKLLPNLTEVVGKVSLIGGHNTFATPFAMLNRVGALYVEHSASLTGFKLPALTLVEGAVEYKGGGPASHPIALARAGSVLIYESAFTSLEQFGGPALEVGGLELRDNGSLASLTSPTNTSKVTLTSSAPLSLSANPGLTASSVCTFVALQSGLGWSGPAALDGVVCP